MQFIQLQPQVAGDLPVAPSGSVNFFIDVTDNTIKLRNENGDDQPVGGGLIEISRDELTTVVNNSGLSVGSFYKITGAASSSFYEGSQYFIKNEIQQGGTTVILQAVTPNSLSKKGVGLFYNPNFEDPNNPTAPPDYNYLVWDNTCRLYTYGQTSTFDINENITIYSDYTTNSTTGSIIGVHGRDSMEIRLSPSDDFFKNLDNTIQLTISGSNSGAGILSDNNYDYLSTYSINDCVIWGGRVWRNLTGNVGYPVDSWPESSLYLNPEDWEIVSFDNLHYTLVADTIEYEYEHDNISYRSDGLNEVRSDFKHWDNNWGYNMIAFFPWGHYGTKNCSISNSYLYSFVNFPHDAEAWDIKIENGGGFNSHRWGRSTGLYNIYGEQGAHFTGHDFGYNTQIYNIKLGLDSYMNSILTYDNGDSYDQIYEITLGNNAFFGDFDMRYNSYIEYCEIGTDAAAEYFTMLWYSRIRDLKMDINSSMYDFVLHEGSEIKYVTIGSNSYISYFDLQDSSCLKRTTIGTDATINSFNLGINSFIRQVNLSERSQITNFSIGDNANLQNIDLGAYSEMYNFNGGQYTNFQNIRLDASAEIYSIYLGWNSRFSDIQVSPNSAFDGVYGGGDTGIFSSSIIDGITINPNSNISDITVGTSAQFQNVYLGSNSYFGQITLEENSILGDITLFGQTESGDILIDSGSQLTSFQVGINSGFGGITLTGSVFLSDIEIGQGSGFGGQTFTSSLSYRTIGRGFTNLFNDNNSYLTPYTGSFGSINDLTTINDDAKGVIIIDITDMPANTVNYRLNNGSYEGQEYKFVVKNNTGSVLPGPTDVRIWCDTLQYPIQYNSSGSVTNSSFAPFAHYDPTYGGGAWVWRTIGRAVWTNGTWVTDAEFYYD